MNDREIRQFGTDLASERRRVDTDICGVNFCRRSVGRLSWEYITVSSKEGAESIGRPMGHYDTLTTPPMSTMDRETLAAASAEVADELCGLSEGILGTFPERVLIVGLGNASLSPDAVGPLTAADVHATLHIKEWNENLFRSFDCAEVAVAAPGVAAQSGMDAAEAVAGIAERIEPDMIVAIDALAARSTDRLGRTVQLSDTGIFPGSGVGNHRLPLTEEALGIPVIAIGVPTVTDSRVFFEEEARRRGIDVPEDRSAFGMFVSPKEIDDITKTAATILSDALNRAFGLRL